MATQFQTRIAKRRMVRTSVTLALEAIEDAFKSGGAGGGSLYWGVAEHLLRVAADQITLAEKAK